VRRFKLRQHRRASGAVLDHGPAVFLDPPDQAVDGLEQGAASTLDQVVAWSDALGKLRV
jgi:hypothetical protein